MHTAGAQRMHTNTHIHTRAPRRMYALPDKQGAGANLAEQLSPLPGEECCRLFGRCWCLGAGLSGAEVGSELAEGVARGRGGAVMNSRLEEIALAPWRISVRAARAAALSMPLTKGWR
jgi:hypothetical protein